MTIKAEHLDIINAHINKTWENGKCPKCSHQSWAVAGYVHLGVSDDIRTITIGGTRLPCAAVTCTNCGLTNLVNLIVAGVPMKSEG